MDRQTYADTNFARYTDWAGQVGNSRYSPLDKLEWAIITAHTPFSASIKGFTSTRGVDGVSELAQHLAGAAVMGPARKAAAIVQLRERITNGEPVPHESYRDYRRTVKLPGLGYCKQSFATCLIDPFGADVVCLDVHMLTVYLGHHPTKTEVGGIYARLDKYESVEAKLLQEAAEVGMPAFPYQWAVWDWWRARTLHIPPQDHSFLWCGGPNVAQLPLFSALEV